MTCISLEYVWGVLWVPLGKSVGVWAGQVGDVGDYGRLWELEADKGHGRTRRTERDETIWTIIIGPAVPMDIFHPTLPRIAE